MKILIVNKFLHPNGGSETYIFELGKQLKKMGHEVQYFGMEHPGRVVGNRLDCYTENMDFHGGGIKKLFYPFKIIYSVEARRKIRTVLEDFQPDVVHLNNFHFQLTPSIIYEIRKFSKQRGRKTGIVYTAHDGQLVCPNHMLFIPQTGERCFRCKGRKTGNCLRLKCIHGSRMKSFLGVLEAKLYQSLKTYAIIDRIICPSRFMAGILNDNPLLEDRMVVLRNFSPGSGKEVVPKKDYVLYFGRYTREKGMDTLLKVCSGLPGVSFVFAGSGPYAERIRGYDNISDRGFLTGNELQTVIREARFSIFPSELYDNCPFSVMESLEAGTPAIGSRLGGIPELIREGINGELFEPGDAEELQAKIARLWDDRGLCEKYAEGCKDNLFDTTEEYCAKLMGIYRQTADV